MLLRKDALLQAVFPFVKSRLMKESVLGGLVPRLRRAGQPVHRQAVRPRGAGGGGAVPHPCEPLAVRRFIGRNPLANHPTFV